MNIALVRISCPSNPSNGGSLRYWHLLRGDAKVICLSPEDGMQPGIEPLEWTQIEILGDGNTKINLTRFGNLHDYNGAFECLVEKAHDFYRLNQNGIIIVGNHEVALKFIDHGLNFVFDPVDSVALYYFRRFKSLSFREVFRKINSLWWSITYSIVERKISKHALAFIIPSKKDKDFLERFCSSINFHAIGNGSAWLEKSPLNRTGDGKTIGFHGGMSWEPNRSAALYLINEILPKLKEIYPSVRLTIAGGPLSPAIEKYKDSPGVEICGYVADIREWMSRCDVYVMPMLQGSGVKNKLIEAMSAGMAIVTNDLGSEAISKECKDALVVANGSDGIASAIYELLIDAKKRSVCRCAAREVAEKEHGWLKYQTEYRQVLKKAIKRIEGMSS